MCICSGRYVRVGSRSENVRVCVCVRASWSVSCGGARRSSVSTERGRERDRERKRETERERERPRETKRD